MSLIHINTNAALLPKATEEIARQTRMKKEGLVCSESLTHNPSIYGGKIHTEKEILPQHLSKRSEKGFNSWNTSRREGWDYKIWNFPCHDEPLAALHRQEHWGSASFQEESFSRASRNSSTGLRLLGFLACWAPRQGNSSSPSSLSLSWSTAHHPSFLPSSLLLLPQPSPVTQALHRGCI